MIVLIADFVVCYFFYATNRKQTENLSFVRLHNLLLEI